MKHTLLSRRTVSLLVVFALCSLLATRVHSDAALSAATIQGVIFRVTVTKLEPVTIAPGALVRYEVKVKNITNRLGSATVVGRAPNSFVYQGATGWGSTCWYWANGMLYCSALRIDAGQEKTVIASYRIPATFSCAQSSVGFQVTVSGAGTTTQTDPLVCTRCGDGVMQLTEQCDDGNQVDNDTCSNTCIAARCGDGITQRTEQCDDGNQVDTDACSNVCVRPRCGDGVRQGAEQCDDGNTVETDACSHTCLAARCGDGILQPSEQCDDGNTVETDACSTACVPARCGDRTVQVMEQCDDGNTAKGDGCSDRCFIETDLSVLPGNMFRTDRSGFGILTFAVFNNGDTPAQNVVFRASGFGTDDFTFTAQEGCQGGGRSISCAIGELRGRDRRIFKVPVQLSARYACNQRGPSFFMSVLQSNFEANPRDNIQQAQIIRDCTFRPSSSSSVSSALSSSSISSVTSSSVSSAYSSTEPSSSSLSSSLASSVFSASSLAPVSSASSASSASSHSASSGPLAVSSVSSAQSSLHAAASSSESSEPVSVSSSSAASISSMVSSSAFSSIRSSASSRSSAQPAVCGNGVREGAEECDDGNLVDGDACAKQCKNEVHLIVTLTGSQLPFKGSTQTYRGTVRNDGPAAANGVMVKIEMPSSSAFVQDAALSSCTMADSSFGRAARCPIGSLEPGASVPFNFTVTVSTSYLEREGIIKVSADTTSKTLPPWQTYSKDLRWTVRSCGNSTLETDWQEQCDDGNAADGDGCTKQCKNEVHMAVTLTGSLTPMKGSSQTYRGIVRNDGSAIAHGVTVTMKIPSQFAFSTSPANCRVVNSPYEDYATCTLDTLAPGGSIPFSLDVTSPSTYADREGRIKVDLATTSQGLPPWTSYSKELPLKVHACGNGTVEEDWREQCDDGNTIDGDQCPNDCTPAVCGDGVTEGLEQCDEGVRNGGTNIHCTFACTIAPVHSVCGNRVIDVGTAERCDDGNTVSGDGCRWDCTTESSGYCGNGRLDAAEECDDGNRTRADGCSECVLDSAGKVVIDGSNIVLAASSASFTVEATNTSRRMQNVSVMVTALPSASSIPEQSLSLVAVDDMHCRTTERNSITCSFMNVAAGQSVRTVMRLSSSVTGKVNMQAQVRSTYGYDPFNIAYYSASSHLKTITVVRPGCGNGVREALEECDWGAMSSPVCSATCKRQKLNACGNGLKETNEECDDGNGSSLDGTCDFLCQSQEPCIGKIRLAGACWHDTNGQKSCAEECTSFGGYDAEGASKLAASSELCKRLYLNKFDATPVELNAVRVAGASVLCMTHAFTGANTVLFGGGLNPNDRYNIYNKRCPCRQ